jgi:hypothetical protein
MKQLGNTLAAIAGEKAESSRLAYRLSPAFWPTSRTPS